MPNERSPSAPSAVAAAKLEGRRLIHRRTGELVELVHIEERDAERRILVEFADGRRGYVAADDLVAF